MEEVDCVCNGLYRPLMRLSGMSEFSNIRSFVAKNVCDIYNCLAGKSEFSNTYRYVLCTRIMNSYEAVIGARWFKLKPLLIPGCRRVLLGILDLK
jgi:hypothetical protein